MALKRPHSDWRMPQISPVDVRAVDLDQVLARLWLRVLHENRPLVSRSGQRAVAELVNDMERKSNSHFEGFELNPGAAEAWLRADLVNTLQRKPEVFTVGRPVHALATRVRNADKLTNDSLVSLLIYAWLDRVDRPLLAVLRDFIEVETEDESLDLASLALGLLGSEQEEDSVKTTESGSLPAPLCLGQAKTFADDLRRLLAYKEVMPRAALIEHIRRVAGMHVGLYLLRVFRITTEVEQEPEGQRTCATCPGRSPRGFGCPHRLELLVDCGEDARSPVAKLAEVAWKGQEDRLAQYVRSHLALKKLHEFARHLDDSQSEDRVPFETLEDVARVEARVRSDLIDLYFEQRTENLLGETSSTDARERLSELRQSYRSMGLSAFRAYVALLTHDSERRWVNYHRYLLDSLFSKNSSEGLMRQPLGGRRRRRAAMGPALLETLTLIAVVEGDKDGYFTRPLRVDQLIERLEHRYGILIATPPTILRDDFHATRTLAVNVERFKARLRETGLFTDLSDAFLAQQVKPRHVLGSAK